MGTILHCLLLAIVFFTVSAFDKNKPSQECHWEGTAPSCEGGDCTNKNDREITRASEDPKSDLAKFGKDCWFGSKTLCCHDTPYVHPPNRG